ncbi:MAG: carboxypeptidase-like regulatory domain-containing protein [Bacteroidales bacterium]|nr:carboxypeptidase-like regulatory domain-containing protein [Bacteroidales bacterium]
MKRTLILLACLLAFGAASAQDNMIAVKGTVTDAKSKEGLPGVTVYVQNGYHYTQTNGDGTFVIKVPEKMLGGNLIFSLFGYERDTLAVKKVQKNPKVKLKEGGVSKLSEVVVSEYTPQTLIKEAVNHIPQNYWTDTTIGTYFYRDVRQLEDSLYLFDEMVFDALRVGYDKHNTSTKPHERGGRLNYKAILFSRLLVNDTAYIKKITSGTGSFRLTYSDNDVLVDPVEIPNTTNYLSTSKSSLKSWKYKMETFTDPDNVEYYLVTMTKKVSSFGPTEYKVLLTVRRNDLAITKLEYNYDSKENDYPWPLNKLSQKVGRDSIYYGEKQVYNYGEIDGKLTLTSYTTHNTATFFYSNDTMYGQREQHFVYDAQCVLTSQRRGDASFLDSNNIQSPVRIAVSDRQAGELRYDEDFWNQYNFVPVEAALLEKLEKKLGRK